MKWVNHQLVTSSAVLALTGSPVMAVLAGGMSPLPDKIDHLCGAFGRTPIKIISHREHSHYWLYWVIVAVLAYMELRNNNLWLLDAMDYIALAKLFLSGNFSTVGEFLLPNLMFWGAVGSLFHIFEDFFSGKGIPLVFPHKISPHIHLYTVGRFSEYIVALFASVACFLAYWFPSEAGNAVRSWIWNSVFL